MPGSFNATYLHKFLLEILTLKSKGGRSAIKFRISQIRKFADFNNLLDLRAFPQMWHLADLWLAIPPVRKYENFLLKWKKV